jgi:hypothetical protein
VIRECRAAGVSDPPCGRSAQTAARRLCEGLAGSLLRFETGELFRGGNDPEALAQARNEGHRTWKKRVRCSTGTGGLAEAEAGREVAEVTAAGGMGPGRSATRDFVRLGTDGREARTSVRGATPGWHTEYAPRRSWACRVEARVRC